MPLFVPGEDKSARVLMRNPTAKAFDYDGVIYLGTDLAVVSEEAFLLGAGEERQVSFPVIMPAVPGTYSVHIGVFSEGQSIALYKSTEDVQIAVPQVEIVRAYIRKADPSVSEAYSGWTSLSPGAELGLGGHSRAQAGALVHNPTNFPLKLTATMYHRYWIEPNNYTGYYLVLPGVEPQRFSPAPTGMPYSNYEYEADKLLGPDGVLAPGETGFVYSELYDQGRRWNYIYLELKSNGYDLGRILLYSGWYSY